MPSAALFVWNRAWLVLLVTMALWGGNGVASRLAVGRITPMSLVFMRWLAVCLLLGLLLRRALREHAPTLRAHRRYIALMAGFGFTGFTVLFYAAAYWTSAVNITLLQAAIPPLVLLGAALTGRGRINAMQIAGLAVTLGAVALIATHGEPWRIAETRFNTGDILILVACVFYAGYTLGLRDRPPLPPLVFFAALAFAALVTSVPFTVAEVATGRFFWPSPGGIAILVFVTLGPSLASQLLYMRGVELIGPSRAGLFSNLTPVFGALFAVLLLREEFHLHHAIALVLALGGIWLSEWGAVTR